MLQAWNFVLVIATFALTILGTFLTRSGVIVSVHSFTQSAIGPVLLWFLMVVLVVSFGLFTSRINVVASSPRLDSLASREGVFLVNNLLLTVFAIVVLTGTLYPMFVEAFSGSQVGVGRPYFDRMAIPLSYALLLAMGVGPVTPYRAARGSVVWERVRTPVRIALGAAAVAVVIRYRNPFLLLGILAATFVMSVILTNLHRSARAMADKNGLSLPRAASRVMRNDQGYWGGQLSHFGVALLALGIALSANLSVEATVELTPGETHTVAGYDIAYIGQFTREETNRTVIGAEVEVSRNGSVATPAVDESLYGDLYLSLKSIDEQGVTLGVWWFPFMWLVWVGGFLAGLAVLWSRLARKPARDIEPVARVAGHDR
jgi:cytochrome c-type biogenesis protein CcmF